MRQGRKGYVVNQIHEARRKGYVVNWVRALYVQAVFVGRLVRCYGYLALMAMTAKMGLYTLERDLQEITTN